MGLNDTPSGERVHIGFFGRRNSGKSSLVNAVTGQEMSLVSDTLGTTTDPVSKTMELLPLGPVVIIDTPGFDDVGELGEQRVRRTRQILNRADMAVLVVDATVGLTAGDRQLVRIFEEKKLPYLIAANKCDLLGDSAPRQAGAAGAGLAAGQAVDTEREATSGLAGDTGRADELGRAVSAWQAANPGLSGDPGRAVMPGLAVDSDRAVMPGSAVKPGEAGDRGRAVMPGQGVASGSVIYVSALHGTNINGLKESMAALTGARKEDRHIVGDMLEAGDLVVLVIPIDESAPKGRLILPQQQTIRDILEAGAAAVCVKDTELKLTLERLGTKPKMVITDSQAFGKVSKEVPDDVRLTSFSILMARYKGFLDTAVMGAAKLDGLRDGDRILVAEGCTHHRQCEDIGTVKLPGWLRGYSGKDLIFETSSGRSFPEDLSRYALVLHCGGCMLNEREMLYRMNCAKDQGVAFTNYGIAIAQVHGILKRSLSVFPELAEMLK
jgi:small GTP-binding protein